MNDYNATPEIIVYGSHCARRKKKNLKYIGAVVNSWVPKACGTWKLWRNT
ncbi:MAG: hypothetical protein V8Q42_08570 [Anaerovoracaceae bacterium]